MKEVRSVNDFASTSCGKDKPIIYRILCDRLHTGELGESKDRLCEAGSWAVG